MSDKVLCPVMDPVVQREEEAFARAAKADDNIKTDKAFGDWLAIGEGLVALRARAMRETGSNSPYGRGYTRHYAALKDKHPWAGHYDASTISHAIWLAENVAAVTRWRDTLSSKQRQEWVHPRVVRGHYDRATKVPVAKPENAPLSPMAEAKAQIIRLQAELDKERSRAEDGSLFDLRRDTAPEIARVIVNTIGEDKITRLIQALQEGIAEKRRSRRKASAHAG